VDVNGRMYVVDTNNHRLVILDQSGKHILALGRAPTFGFIQKVALDGDRHVFITDSDRNAVIAFLGSDVPVPFDGWARDYIGDNGAEPSDPAFTLASPDILVRHNPDGLEPVAFEHPRYDQDNYVYVTVRNRGTQDLRDAVALLYWADPAGAMKFPTDWSD